MVTYEPLRTSSSWAIAKKTDEQILGSVLLRNEWTELNP